MFGRGHTEASWEIYQRYLHERSPGRLRYRSAQSE